MPGARLHARGAYVAAHLLCRSPLPSRDNWNPSARDRGIYFSFIVQPARRIGLSNLRRQPVPVPYVHPLTSSLHIFPPLAATALPYNRPPGARTRASDLSPVRPQRASVPYSPPCKTAVLIAAGGRTPGNVMKNRRAALIEHQGNTAAHAAWWQAQESNLQNHPAISTGIMAQPVCASSG